MIRSAHHYAACLAALCVLAAVGCGSTDPGRTLSHDQTGGSSGQAGSQQTRAGTGGAGAGGTAAVGGSVDSGTISVADAGAVHDAAAADGGSDAGSGAVVTTFVLDNQGPGVALLPAACESWARLSNAGQGVGFEDGDCRCECGKTDASCGVCLPLCVSSGSLLVPGTQATQTWDGIARLSTPAGCFTREVFPLGSTLIASTCYGDFEHGNARCEGDQPFSYGQSMVTVSVTPTNTPIPTPMTIVNQTGASISIVTEHCGQPTWFQLTEDQPHASLNAACACACNADFSAGACPQCGACGVDKTETIAAGGSFTSMWDGQFWYTYESGCAKQYAMPAGHGVAIRICYTKAGASEPMCVYSQELGTLGEEQSFLVAG